MISVCLASYNGEKYIEAQIRSILCQLGQEDELIISDDGSFDDTIRIINSFCDRRIKLIHHTKRAVKHAFFYTSLNFENALENARGEYIFLADQDDVWAENKLVECLELLKDYSLVLHNCSVVDQNMKTVHHSYFDLKNSKKGIIRNLLYNSYLGCCMCFRREVLEKALPIGNEEIPHDIWLGLVSEKYFKVKFLDKQLLSYRRHGENLSASSEKSRNSFAYKIYYRFLILKKIIKL